MLIIKQQGALTMKMLWDIFFSFAKVGTFTFGGGYAMLPILQKEVIGRRAWLSNEDIVDYYAVAQCLPGVIAVNTAAFVGHKLKGKPGAIAAVFGVVLPSFVIITVIAAFIQNFLEYEIVQRALFGINVIVCALIAQAVINLWKSAIKNIFGIAIYLTVLGLAIFTNIHIVALIAAALATGIAADALQRRKAKESGK